MRERERACEQAELVSPAPRLSSGVFAVRSGAPRVRARGRIAEGHFADKLVERLGWALADAEHEEQAIRQ